MSRSRAEIPKLDTFHRWIQVRIRNRDTDQFGHVNHAAMATLFEEGRIALVFAPELNAEMTNVDLLVVRLAMNFHQELKAPGNVEVGSVVTRIGTSSFDVHQAIFNGSACVASAEAVCVLLGKKTRRPSPVSEVMRNYLNLGDTVETSQHFRLT